MRRGEARDRGGRLQRRDGALLRRVAEEGRTEEADDAVADHLVEDAAVLPQEAHRARAPAVDELGDRRRALEHLLAELREAVDVGVEDRDRCPRAASGSARGRPGRSSSSAMTRGAKNCARWRRSRLKSTRRWLIASLMSCTTSSANAEKPCSPALHTTLPSRRVCVMPGREHELDAVRRSRAASRSRPRVGVEQLVAAVGERRLERGVARAARRRARARRRW